MWYNLSILSETFLNFEILSNDSNLEIPGHNSVRAGACVFYKNSLSLTIINISYLQKRINFETKIDNNTYNFICLYRSSS